MLYGFIGFFLALVLFGSGVFCGVKISDAMRKRSTAAAEETLGETERRRLIAEQTAFRTLLNYTPEMAYGLDVSEYVHQDDEEAVV